MEANAVILGIPLQCDPGISPVLRGTPPRRGSIPRDNLRRRGHSARMPVTPPRVNEVEVQVRNLDPRHDGVRIAQLSDIHVGHMTPAAHVRAAIDAANGAQPDVIALTGDYVSWRRHEAELAGEQLAGLRRAARARGARQPRLLHVGRGRDERACAATATRCSATSTR